MVKRIFYILFFLCVTLSVQAQVKSMLYNKGKQALDREEYFAAESYLGRAFLLDSTDLKVAFDFAMALKGKNDYNKAAHYFNYVSGLDTSGAYHTSLFWLGTLQKNLGNYNDARSSFAEFLDKDGVKQGRLIKKAEMEVRECNPEAIEPVMEGVTVSNAGAVNSSVSEFGVFKISDSTVGYTSPEEEADGNVYSRIFIADYSDGRLEDPRLADSLFNLKEVSVANGAYSSDGYKFYFSVCDGASDCDIYMSEFQRGSWQPPEPLPEKINLPGSSDTQPFSTNIDGKEVLLFASDRDEGMGSYDIWYTVNNNQQWSEPENLGEVVNSPQNEVCPFYLPEEGELYFSSEWHCGYGGFDIFRSRGSLRKLSSPVNLGVPVNSAANDLYFWKNAQGKGFLSSNRTGGKTGEGAACCNDIYFYSEPAVVAEEKVSPADTLIQLERITFYFGHNSPSLAGKKPLPYHKLSENDTNVLQQSDSLLEKIYYLLQKDIDIDLNLTSYTSLKGNTEYNKRLAERRNSSVIEYLKLWRNSDLVPYINSGKLHIVKKAVGESDESVEEWEKRRVVVQPSPSSVSVPVEKAEKRN